jgi:hypothetical protein
MAAVVPWVAKGIAAIFGIAKVGKGVLLVAKLLVYIGGTLALSKISKAMAPKIQTATRAGTGKMSRITGASGKNLANANMTPYNAPEAPMMGT